MRGVLGKERGLGWMSWLAVCTASPQSGSKYNGASSSTTSQPPFAAGKRWGPNASSRQGLSVRVLAPRSGGAESVVPPVPPNNRSELKNKVPGDEPSSISVVAHSVASSYLSTHHSANGKAVQHLMLGWPLHTFHDDVRCQPGEIQPDRPNNKAAWADGHTNPPIHPGIRCPGCPNPVSACRTRSVAWGGRDSSRQRRHYRHTMAR